MARLRRHADPQQGQVEIFSWRVGVLREAGFGKALADRVARDGRHDIHALLELVDRGCHPELAVRIRAPLDEEPTHPC
jgi:hypothetical protein